MQFLKRIGLVKEKPIDIQPPRRAIREQNAHAHFHNSSEYKLPTTNVNDILQEYNIQKDEAMRKTTDVLKILQERFESSAETELPSNWTLKFKLNRKANIRVDDPKKYFELKRQIYSSTFGRTKVYEAMDRRENRRVAIKICKSHTIMEIKNEVGVHSLSTHPNVVPYLDTFEVAGTKHEYWIITAFMDLGNLNEVIQKAKEKDVNFSEEQIGYVLEMILHALRHLHAEHRIHRDLKSENILLDTEGRVKIADFKLATTLTKEFPFRKSLVGTPYWMAPEVAMGTNYTEKADIWSLGIIALELCDGDPPLLRQKVSPLKALFHISTGDPPTLNDSNQWSLLLNSFVSQALVKLPDERASADTLFYCDFVNGACLREKFSPLLRDLMDVKQVSKPRKKTKRKRLAPLRQSMPVLFSNSKLRNGQTKISKPQDDAVV